MSQNFEKLKIVPVILCGGEGWRLWPVSTPSNPKQFSSLLSDSCLFQETLSRVKDVELFSDPVILTNRAYLDAVQSIGKNFKIILEDKPLNTAPITTICAFYLQEHFQNCAMLILPSDHLITDNAAFVDEINKAVKPVSEDLITLFGIKPTSAETGYGYIKAGDELYNNCFTVEKFIEKPPLELAKKMYNDEKYYWNSGIYCLKPSTLLQEMERHHPELYKACQKAYENSKSNGQLIEPNFSHLSDIMPISIDYAISEKTNKNVFIPVSFAWSDVGSWPAVWQLKEKDQSNNVIEGNATQVKCQNSYISSSSNHIIAYNIKDIAVISTESGTLIAPLAHCGNLNELKPAMVKSYEQSHAKVQKPWGYYKNLDACENYKIKKIVVKPGEKLSLQKHQHRCEHWFVLKGEILVTQGSKQYSLTEQQHAFIKAGEIHRIENNTDHEAIIVELQLGDILDEEDIIRLEDVYGRVS